MIPPNMDVIVDPFGTVSGGAVSDGEEHHNRLITYLW